MKLLELLLMPLGWLLRGKRADERLSVTRELSTTDSITVLSTFAHGEVIPSIHCGFGIGKNVSPALRWQHLPEGTRTLLLIIEDIDTPTTRPAIHTVALFDAAIPELEDGALTRDDPRFRYVPNHRGGTGYVGPRPLPGHGTHRYRFHLYALDTDVDTSGVTAVDGLLPRLAGHVLAGGMLEGIRSA
ncbi:hypothetical protein FHX82_004500 [Amycolatopsis bartoniae]|uniref:Phosphatidylethanolamine-binding protein n=1 Tax=Amycolatopsis bartoniae TaxID=941986 RepID=A0A8H9J285_9PSEU|nr:YbhB/YbcL family Raf kinase inhibitor-like protein [Amycolatopsis bartoniae]MBB2937427.1 hypothetical protein [Amycolatopsis bartoniae]TVT00085.1 YbhB/YbcL family Raf kinase inhibitor-like protein [Amycolatopsis bartoniae]GHF86700.1 phosphatidylethanolamine-binding protein [Amycolatopsis bartoniae]